MIQKLLEFGGLLTNAQTFEQLKEKIRLKNANVDA